MRSDHVVGRTAAALAATAFLLSAPASHAQDGSILPDGRGTNVKSGSARTRLTLFGQVNRAFLRANDGSDSGVFFVDNDNSSTRIGLVGEAPATAEISVGSTIVFEVQSDSSRSVSLPSTSGSLGSAAFNDRRLEVYGRHVRLGTAWLGQGHTASDGAAETDLTKTNVVTSSDLPDLAGGIRFGGSGPRIRSVYTNMDGLGRDDRIRYDSPVFQGFQGSGSYLTGGDYDIAVRFRGNLADMDVAGAAALADAGATTSANLEQYVVSASASMDNGFSGAIAIGTQSINGTTRDPTFFYVKVAYETTLVDYGTTSFAADYGRATDIAAADDVFSAFGVYAVQRVDRAAADVYLGIRNHSLERTGATFSDILAVMFGARVRF